MLARRSGLAPGIVAANSRAITSAVLALPEWQQAVEALVYLPIRGEVDASALAESLLARGGRVLLPRCRDNAPGQLDLGCVSCLTEALPGRYGIPEPPADVCRPPEAFAPDVIVVPAVAFDRHGTRLGFGGGYYDRLLALPMAQKACLIGLAHDFQLVPRLPAEAWDKPVHLVVTELQTLRITP